MLDETLRQRKCCYCCTRIRRDDSWNQDDDQFIAYECDGGHTVYVPRLCRQSNIIRLYVWRDRVLAHDALIGGEWQRIELEGACDASHYALCLRNRGYRNILNRGYALGDRSNPYRYFRKERDEEQALEAKRVHWEERKAIESSLPVMGW